MPPDYPRMNAYFQELGRAVYDLWKQEDFSLPAFPRIAQQVLEGQPPSEKLDLGALIRDFLLQDEQPFQSSAGFGQPELIVYDNQRFYIQVLFWLEGTTDIHQHGFCGAFHVQEGSSIHSRFLFKEAREVTAHFRVGNLKLVETELLEKGRTVQIGSGRSCIHSLFHLETPSVTVVVRTHSDPGTGPQFTYLPPHVALDPVQHDAQTLRRKQLLDLLEHTCDPSYPGLVREMLAELDFERGFFILQNCVGYLRSLGEWDEMLRVFSKKHGAAADFVEPTLDEIIRRDRCVAMRSSIDEVDHRFFLALLLNLQDRSEILKMIAQRYPGDPLQQIATWAEELTQFSEVGTWILDAQFPEELPLEEEYQPTVFLAALNFFLAGGKAPKELKSLSKADLKAVRAAFARSNWASLLLPEQ